MILFLLRLAVAALLLADGGDSRPGDFRIIGPGGGGATFHPSISPHDPQTVLVSCDMTGSYITHDAGKSWRMFNLRGVAAFFVFDPLDRKVIYAQSNGLWRSQDEGETWRLVYPSPSSVKSIKMSSDHSDEDLIAEPNPLGNITPMAIDPADRQRRSPISLPDSGRMASRSFMLSVTHRLTRRMTKGQLGERPAWVRRARKCERSPPASAIQRRPMSPIETWKSAASNG